MKIQKPELPEDAQNMGKLTALIQLVCFLVIFIGIYLILRKIVHAALLRILILIVDYAVTALITYLFIRPAALKLEAKLKKK